MVISLWLVQIDLVFLKIQRALKNGDLVGMLPDQDPWEGGWINGPFFWKKS